MSAVWESIDDAEPDPQPGMRTARTTTKLAVAAPIAGVIRAT